MLPFIPAQMTAEQKGFGDRAMNDGVYATVSVEQPITLQDQSSQTTYHPKNGEKTCRVANSMAFLVVKFVRLKMKLQLGGTRGCSPVKRERGLIKSS